MSLSRRLSPTDFPPFLQRHLWAAVSRLTAPSKTRSRGFTRDPRVSRGISADAGGKCDPWRPRYHVITKDQPGSCVWILRRNKRGLLGPFIVCSDMTWLLFFLAMPNPANCSIVHQNKRRLHRLLNYILIFPLSPQSLRPYIHTPLNNRHIRNILLRRFPSS